MLHPSLEPILKETYGVIIYQEQVMQIAQVLSGYSLGEADLLRRAMGKKKKEEMDLQKARFASGAAANGVAELTRAEFIFEMVAKFAGYGFNKSHAAAYAVIAYQTAWLKANAPVEFFAASMSLDISNTDKLAIFSQDAKRFGVVVRPPDINRSSADFEVEDGEVLYALGAIRNVGEQAMEHVAEVRREGRRLPGPVRLFWSGSIPATSTSGRWRTWRGRAPSIPFIPTAPPSSLGRRRPDGYAQTMAERAGVVTGDALGSTAAGASRPSAAEGTEPWVGPAQLDEELAAVGFYLTGHPLEDMVEVLRRRRVCAVRRGGPAGGGGGRGVPHGRCRASSPGTGVPVRRKVRLRLPLRSHRRIRGAVPARILRRCRDVLEPGQAVMLKVRAKAKDGEVRFFGDDAEPVGKAVEADVGGSAHPHRRAWTGADEDFTALKRRLDAGSGQRGGEVALVAALGDAGEVEMRLPGLFMPGRRAPRRPEDRAGGAVAGGGGVGVCLSAIRPPPIQA